MFIYGFIVCTIIMIIMNLFLTKAKYKLTESIPIARGTITTTGYDFKIMALYELEDNGNEKTLDIVPDGSKYIINKAKSYCTNDNKEKVYDKLETINGKHTFSDLKKNDKCYVWFMKNTLANETLNKLNQTVKGTPTFTGTSCEGNCTLKENGLYYGEDDFGDSYVYRGTVDNNWVVFGKDTKNSNEYIWWRIIRINGNGTLRLMYAGTSSNTTEAPDRTGNGTMITPQKQINSNEQYKMAVKFNEQYNDNKYVGYMYGEKEGEASTNYETAHKPETKSTILKEVENWYTNNTDLGSLSEYIDVETGFCGDRTLATENHRASGPGYGKEQSEYVSLDRVKQQNSTNYRTDEQTPTLKCANTVRDLYTGPSATGETKGIDGNVEGNNALSVPVGLITMDEVIYSGGFGGKTNNGYWLYTNQFYWIMSPCDFYEGRANIFHVAPNGLLSGEYVNNNINGVRPVINLKADVTFESGGNGTPTNPYIVQTN